MIRLMRVSIDTRHTSFIVLVVMVLRRPSGPARHWDVRPLLPRHKGYKRGSGVACLCTDCGEIDYWWRNVSRTM